MLFDLSTNEGEWFPFQNSRIDSSTGEPVFDDPVTDAKVQIRSMTPFFEERIAKRKRQTEHVMNPKTRQMERISFYADLSIEDARAERDDAFDYAITGIEGFKDAKTQKMIDCTRENKLSLMRVPVFDRFFARCQQLIASSGVKQAEEAEKNFSKPQNG
jgi:peptide methionine sulfoxide reductase MsrB